ncbi:MAG: hypothetical protein ACRDRN_08220 [Sciscionella sp.]
MPLRSITGATVRIACAFLALALAGGLAACGSSAASQPGNQARTPAEAAAATQLPTFEIDAGDGMRYTLPKRTAPSGSVMVTLVNRDEDMAHQAQLFRLHDGVTMKQFTEELLSPGGIGAVLPLSDPSGGPDAVGPGHKASVVTVLAPSATYAVICSVPGKDGTPHYMHGMVTSFTTAATEGKATPPDVASTITMRHMRYQVPASVDWSKPIEVANKSTDDPHEMQVLGPAPGKTLKDVQHYLMAPPGSAPAAPPPYRAYGGVAALAPGGHQIVTLHLPAGHYVLLCFVVDPKTHMPHFAMGMLTPITVS